MFNGIMLQCLWLPRTPAPQSIWMGGAGLRGAGAAAKNADSGSFDFAVPFGAVAADVSKLEPGARDVRRCRCCNDHAHQLDEIHTGKVMN
jgi:hypothetical protein